MTPPNRHRIQRQVVELLIDPDAPAPVMQSAFAREYWDEIVPELTRVFDVAAGADELLRLDRLEIDLGRIEGSDWAPQLRQRLAAALTRRLEMYRPEPTRPATSTSDQSTVREPLRQFLYFLAHGLLPWWGTRPQSSWDVALPDSPVGSDWAALRATLLAEPRARVRCVDALADDSLERAVVAWSGLTAVRQVLECLTPARLAPTPARRWRRRSWLLLFDWALSERRGADSGVELLQALLDVRRAHAVDERSRKTPANGADAKTAEVGEPTDTPISAALPAPWSVWFAQIAQNAREASSRTVEGRAFDHGTARLRLAIDKPREPERALPSHDETLYLACAGTILLHPFLETLFRERGLIEDRGFRDEASRQHAVHLVGLLGCGRDDAPEYDLAIAKLLCGHPLKEPIEPAALEVADVAACEAMLDAVLGHWSALRSSSAHWLRAQFFQRDGKLERVDGGFRLTVERRAQDVLLARLPWGFGVINLPWLRDRLFVHWLD